MELFKALPSSKNIFANSTGYVKEELSADIPKHTVECRGVSWWETVSAKRRHSVLRQHLDDELPQEVQEGLLDPLHPNPPGIDSADTENLNLCSSQFRNDF